MNILLDTNILLDVLLKREPWVADARSIWAACEQGRLTGSIPASALTDIFYIARRATDIPTANIAVNLCLATFVILPVDRATLEQAVTLSGNDFEGDVQIACAVLGGLDAIATRNPDDFTHASLPILSPAELLAHL